MRTETRGRARAINVIADNRDSIFNVPIQYEKWRPPLLTYTHIHTHTPSLFIDTYIPFMSVVNDW